MCNDIKEKTYVPAKVGDFRVREDQWSFKAEEIVAVGEFETDQFSGDITQSVVFVSKYGLFRGWTYLPVDSFQRYSFRSSEEVLRVVEDAEKSCDITYANSLSPSKFGTVQEIAEVWRENRFDETYRQKIYRFLFDGNHFHNNGSGQRFLAHAPKEESDGRISLFLNYKDYKRDRRTTMKPGRAFKAMLPDLKPTEVAGLAESWIEMSSPRELTLLVGDNRASFRKAYLGKRASYRNPTTTTYRKSLATSCMHGVRVYDDSEGREISAAEAYASGDFAVAWLETPEGHVAGRMVFSKGPTVDKPVAAPAYGACEQSLDILTDYVETNGLTFSDDLFEWSGLSLLLIKDEGRIVGPYMDGDIGGEEGRNRIHLEYNDGSLLFNSTDGYASNGHCCHDCGAHTSEDMAYHTPDGLMFCEHCFDQNWVITEDGDTIPVEDSVSAYTYSSFTGRSHPITVHVDEAVYSEELDEYWLLEECEYSDETGDYIPCHLIEDYPDHFPSESEEGVDADERIAA